MIEFYLAAAGVLLAVGVVLGAVIVLCLGRDS